MDKAELIKKLSELDLVLITPEDKYEITFEHPSGIGFEVVYTNSSYLKFPYRRRSVVICDNTEALVERIKSAIKAHLNKQKRETANISNMEILRMKREEKLHELSSLIDMEVIEWNQVKIMGSVFTPKFDESNNVFFRLNIAGIKKDVSPIEFIKFLQLNNFNK